MTSLNVITVCYLEGLDLSKALFHESVAMETARDPYIIFYF